jgi:hypothetical protein
MGEDVSTNLAGGLPSGAGSRFPSFAPKGGGGALLAALLISGSSGCSGRAGAEHIGTSRSPIINGVASTDTSVVEVIALSSGGVAQCSGTYLGGGLVITAAHCLDEAGTYLVDVDFVDFDSPSGTTSLSATSYEILPKLDGVTQDTTNDLAWVAVDFCKVPSFVTTKRVLAGENGLGTRDVGTEAIAIGFGETTNGTMPTSGAQNSGTVQISKITDTSVTVANHPSITCQGDSGGPLVVQRSDGDYAAASLSTGDCQTESTYTRFDIGGNATFVQSAIQASLISALATECLPGGGSQPRCSVVAPGRRGDTDIAWFMLPLGLVLLRRRRHPRRTGAERLVASAGLVMLAGGCSSSSSGNQSTVTDCVDTASAVANAMVRCKLSTYQEAKAQFVDGVAAGNCDNVESVRDEAALRATCIPSLETISCNDLSGNRLDPSCTNQFARTSQAETPFDARAAVPR